MGAFKWTEELDVGVEAMNVEHRGLIAQMNALVLADERCASLAEIDAALDRLGKGIEGHFRSEEAYMKSIAYPDYRAHRRLHLRLLEQFDEHSASVRATGRVGAGFKSFLERWLLTHFKGVDVKYGEHSP